MERGRIEMDSSAAPSEERGRVEMDPVVGQGESALRGAAQGASLGFADELAGGGEALLDKLRGAHEALGELYLKHRDESRRAYKAAEEANPGTYMAGQIGGGLATAAIPGLGAGGLVAQGLKMGALGAVAGAGASEAQDARELVKDAAVSGLVGGATGVAVGGIARGMGKIAQHMQPTADRLTAMGAGVPVEMAGAAREAGIAGPLTTPASAEKAILSKIATENAAYPASLGALDESAAGISRSVPRPPPSAASIKGVSPEVAEQIAARMPAESRTVIGGAMSGNTAADALEQQLAKFRAENPARSSAQESAYNRAIQNFRAKGDAPISFDEMAAFKQRAAGQAKSFGTPGADANKDIAAALKGHLESAATEVNPGAAADLAARNERLSQLYQLQDVQRVPQAGGGLMKMGAVGGLITGHPVGAATAGAGMLAKKYGPSLLGAGLDKIAKAAQNPGAAPALGKWATYLMTAAQRGPGALAVAHYTAAQTDPAYAAAARDAMEQ